MNRSHEIGSVDPAASSEEAAAIVAALERFVAETLPVIVTAPSAALDPWRRAALLEGVRGLGEHERPEPWINN